MAKKTGSTSFNFGANAKKPKAKSKSTGSRSSQGTHGAWAAYAKGRRR